MAYQMAATAVTLNDLEGHSPVAGLFQCNPSNICAAFYTISTDSVLAVPLRQLNFLYESGDQRQENSLCQKHGKWIQDTQGAFRKPTSIGYVAVIVRPTQKNILKVQVCRSSVVNKYTEKMIRHVTFGYLIS